LSLLYRTSHVRKSRRPGISRAPVGDCDFNERQQLCVSRPASSQNDAESMFKTGVWDLGSGVWVWNQVWVWDLGLGLGLGSGVWSSGVLGFWGSGP
jgi:hypothetical protein